MNFHIISEDYVHVHHVDSGEMHIFPIEPARIGYRVQSGAKAEQSKGEPEYWRCVPVRDVPDGYETIVE